MERIQIKLAGVTGAEAQTLSEDLRRAMRQAEPSLQIDRQRDDPKSQDLGTVLSIVLGAPVSITLARAILAWAKSNNRVSIELWSPEGTLSVRGLESKDAPGVIEAFRTTAQSKQQ